MEDIEKWINFNNGYGYRSSYGDELGCSYGCGFSDDFEDGSGSGSGRGDGYGDGCSYGFGDGYGTGAGDSDSCGYGYNFSFGYNYGILKINGKNIQVIDNIQTIISHIKGNVAKGFILNNDLTMTPCYIVKGNGYFAHGKSIREARDYLVKKYMGNMDVEEVIEKFLSKFKKGKRYKGAEFFEWHSYLTGSCLMGREKFVKNRQIDLNEEFTVEEFIDLCKNDYGKNAIEELEKRWSERYEEHD